MHSTMLVLVMVSRETNLNSSFYVECCMQSDASMNSSFFVCKNRNGSIHVLTEKRLWSARHGQAAKFEEDRAYHLARAMGGYVRESLPSQIN